MAPKDKVWERVHPEKVRVKGHSRGMYQDIRMSTKFLFLLSLAVLFCRSGGDVFAPPCGVSLVLLGSNGDLAKRYLWPAIFHDFSKGKAAFQQAGCELVVYGTVTKAVTNQSELWLETTANIECSTTVDLQCQESLDRFKKATLFIQVKLEFHYKKLSVHITADYARRGLTEIGRVFYLAVPPSAYSGICKNIHLHARSSEGWTRVVLEKPFGDDLTSAQLLADSLSNFFSEEEIYRVDHYLGKFGVQQILPFRQMNDVLLSPMWNKEQISYIEVAMKERLDTAGRSRFYDKYGVIRDVFQNHLTEILVQLTMDLPPSTPDKVSYLKAKSKLLSVVYPPRVNQVILGQYVDYQQHLAQDGLPQNPGNASRTPTYASVLVYLGNPKWTHVPFILTSGKQLSRRSAYTRVVLRERLFSLVPRKTSCPPEIIFLIQDEELGAPGILFSTHFTDSQFKLPFLDSTTWVTKTVEFPPGGSLDCQYSFSHPDKPTTSNPYISLLEAVFDGRSERFVDTDSLIRSWIIWTPLLKEIQLIRPTVYLYSQTALENLDFHLQNSHLVGSDVSGLPFEQDAITVVQSVKADSRLSALFQAPTYVRHEYELGSLLAEHVYTAAVHSTNERSSFHLALPGGASPRPFLQSLTLNFQHIFPWQQTHIWQTDERCVTHSSASSNFRQLSELLLSLSPILYPMVHPIPVELLGGVCMDDNSGILLYEKQLLEYANNGTLDYVLLGLGSDGHFASLFPEEALTSIVVGTLVNMVTLKEQYPIYVKRRITLSYEAVLQARHIGLLITGDRKAKVMRRLRQCLAVDSDCSDLPVVKLIKSATKGQLTVYVDAQLNTNESS